MLSGNIGNIYTIEGQVYKKLIRGSCTIMWQVMRNMFQTMHKNRQEYEKPKNKNTNKVVQGYFHWL